MSGCVANKRVLLALSLACLASAAWSEPSVSLAHLPAGHAVPAQFAAGVQDERFADVPGELMPIGRLRGDWWRVTSRVHIPAAERPRLSLTEAALFEVRLWRPGEPVPRVFRNYGPDDGGGAADSRSSRGLEIPLGETVRPGAVFYLYITARGPTPLRAALETAREARQRDDLHTRVRYSLLSMMGVVALLALGFALALGERGFGLFAVAIVCQMFYLALLGGEIRIPAHDPVAATILAGRAVVGVGVAAFAWFVRQYLELPARQPRLATLFLVAGVLSLAKIALNLFGSQDWLGVFGNLLIIAVSIATLIAALRGCWRRERAAGYMLIAWLPTLTFSVMAAMQGLGRLQGARWLQYAFAASFAYSGLVLALGLIERSQRVRRERHAALLQSEQRGRQLATASHDIRQPLVALRSTLARLTRESELPSPVMERFRSSVEYLDRLAAEYAVCQGPGRATREAGARTGGEVLPLDMLVRNLELMFRDEAEAKGLEFRVRSCPAQVRIDAMAAMRVASNLVANAVKYTPRGGVLIGCRRAGARVALVVVDTGPGMPPEELARVFREGVRGSSAAGSEGLGLGLSIAARLSALYGFGLAVASRPGRGTRFSLELPLAAPE